MEGGYEGFLQVLSSVAVGHRDNGDDTSRMHCTKHFSHQCGLPKSTQEVSKKHRSLGSIHIEEAQSLLILAGDALTGLRVLLPQPFQCCQARWLLSVPPGQQDHSSILTWLAGS